MPTYPTSPVPIPIYPAGIQGPVTVLNSGETSISVSPISAPFSGFSLSKGGSIEWPANTPLWVYGEPGGLVSIGGGSALVGATPAPVVNVQVPVVTTPTDPTPTPENPNPGPTDEDEMRVYSSAQIAALTAADKATNYTIWNTDTQSLNYVVNGAVIAPSYGGTLKSQGTYTGTGAAQTIALPFTPDLVLIGITGAGNGIGFGLIHRSDDQATLQTNQTIQSSGSSSFSAGSNVPLLVANGFAVKGSGPALNANGTVYAYTAFKFNTSTVQAVSSSPTPTYGESTVLASKSFATTFGATQTIDVGKDFNQVMLTLANTSFLTGGGVIWVGQTATAAVGISINGSAQPVVISPTSGFGQVPGAGGFGLWDSSNQAQEIRLQNVVYDKATGLVSFQVRTLSNTNTSSPNNIVRWRAF